MKETWGLKFCREVPQSLLQGTLANCGTHSLARSEEFTYPVRAMKLSEREWQGQARKIEVEVISCQLSNGPGVQPLYLLVSFPSHSLLTT